MLGMVGIAVSAEPFVITGLEWSGLEFEIYPGPVLVEREVVFGTERIYITADMNATITVSAVREPSPGAISARFNFWGEWSPLVWSPQTGWQRRSAIEGAEWVGPLAWRHGIQNMVWAGGFNVNLSAETEHRVARVEFLPPPQLSVNTWFSIHPPNINTANNTVTFDIRSFADDSSILVMSAQFDSLGRFAGIELVSVDIPADESRTATIGFNDNSQIMIWESGSMQPIIAPFIP